MKAKENCVFCGGTGEAPIMGQVYPNEPIYAPIGVQKCLCTLEEDAE